MRRSNRRTLALLIVAASLALGTVTPAGGVAVRRPSLAFATGVPEDVQAVARSTWIAFTEGFAARWSCMGGLIVSTTWSLPDRATYDPEGRRVTLRIPGTASNLRESLVHEFAHHVDFACADVAALRRPFLAAQGLSPTTRWYGGSVWPRIPAEQFAEAAVLVVLGRSAHPRLYASPAAVAVVRAWAEDR
jgi:hypothetical protein